MTEDKKKIAQLYAHWIDLVRKYDSLGEGVRVQLCRALRQAIDRCRELEERCRAADGRQGSLEEALRIATRILLLDSWEGSSVNYRARIALQEIARLGCADLIVEVRKDLDQPPVGVPPEPLPTPAFPRPREMFYDCVAFVDGHKGADITCLKDGMPLMATYYFPPGKEIYDFFKAVREAGPLEDDDG